MSVRQALRRSGLILAVFVPTIAAATAAAAADFGTGAIAPPFSAEERARAIVEPSVVFLQFTGTGVLRDKTTGAPLHTGTTTVTVRCSAVVVHSSGIAVTDRGCVAPGQGDMNYWATENIARERKLAGEELKAFFQQGYIFTGDIPTEPPLKRITAQGNSTNATGNAEGTWKAELVGPGAESQQLAIVKIDQTSLPALELGRFETANDLLSVKSTIAAGYSPVGAMSLILRSRPINVLELTNNTPKSTFEIEQELAWETRGGPVTDMDGKIVGILAPNSGKVKALRTTAAITAQLDAAGVTAELSPNDQLYRQGLDDYFEGRYADAIRKLDQVAVGQLNFGAVNYRELAKQREAAEGGTGPSTLLMVVIAVGAALVVALIVIVIMMVKLRRRRMNLAPTSGYPLAYGSPIEGYNPTIFNYPISAPPETPISASPYDYSTQGQFAGFPQQPTTNDPAGGAPAWPAPPWPAQPPQHPQDPHQPPGPQQR